jgi:hypothetical protein
MRGSGIGDGHGLVIVGDEQDRGDGAEDLSLEGARVQLPGPIRRSPRGAHLMLKVSIGVEF